MHALTCNLRRRWLRWRIDLPFWRDDKTAQMLGIAQYGCRRCGRGAAAGVAAESTRPIPPAEDYPDMPCEDCEQGLSSCCVPPAKTCVGPDLRRELNEALDWNANLVKRIEPVVARAIAQARAEGSRRP